MGTSVGRGKFSGTRKEKSTHVFLKCNFFESLQKHLHWKVGKKNSNHFSLETFKGYSQKSRSPSGFFCEIVILKKALCNVFLSTDFLSFNTAFFFILQFLFFLKTSFFKLPCWVISLFPENENLCKQLFESTRPFWFEAYQPPFDI